MTILGGKILFPSVESSKLDCLEELFIHCHQLEEVFPFEDLNLECYGVPRLKTVTLIRQPELKSIWTELL